MTTQQIKAKELEINKLRGFIRTQHLSISTEKSYCRQVARYIDFLCSRRWGGTPTRKKVEAFLTADARRGVAGNTQNGAFYAVCYYYRHIRHAPLENVQALRAKRGERVRQAPSRDEIRELLVGLNDPRVLLVAKLLYGCGLRLGEALALRLKDVNLTEQKLTVVGGKGNKDRFVNIPCSLVQPLQEQIQNAESGHRNRVAPTQLPHLLHKKYPAAGFARRWFWLFPMAQPCDCPRTGAQVVWHCLPETVQRMFRKTGTGVTPHHLRHAWATHAHDSGANVRDIQEILGHKNLETTMRYLKPDAERVVSPLETL